MDPVINLSLKDSFFRFLFDKIDEHKFPMYIKIVHGFFNAAKRLLKVLETVKHADIYISIVVEPDYSFVDTIKDVDVLEHNTGEMVCLVSHEGAPVSGFTKGNILKVM